MYWTFAIGFCLTLVVANRFWRSYVVLPVLFVVCAIAFHALLVWQGTSIEEARSMGLLLGHSTGLPRMWPSISIQDFGRINWLEVLAQSANMLVFILVFLVIAIMALAQIEIGTSKEFDWNKEFKTMGIGSLICGSSGGIPGCLVASGSLLHHKLNADTPITSIVIGLMAVFLLFVGGNILLYIPGALAKGVLLFVGYTLVKEWLIDSRRRLSLQDYAIVLLMVVVILTLGFLEGVMIGVVVCTAFFVYQISRTDLIHDTYSLSERRSKELRSLPDQTILRGWGEQVVIYRLGGYLFFGSAYSLTNQLRGALQIEPKPICLMLDFYGVSGFDISAIESLRNFILTLHSTDTQIVISSSSPRFHNELQRNLASADYEKILWSSNEEAGRAQCEELLINKVTEEIVRKPGVQQALRDSVIDDLAARLQRLSEFEKLVEELKTDIEIQSLESNQEITGESKSDVTALLLVKGRVSIFDSSGLLHHQCGPGDVVDVRIFAQGDAKGSNAITEELCELIRIRSEDLDWLQEHKPELLLRTCRYLVSTHHFIPAYDRA